MLAAIRGVLALIQASDGRIETRIRMQKEAYLLKWLGCPAFENIHFAYRFYGPYSRQLSDGLRDTVTTGVVVETTEDWDDGNKYCYELGEVPDDLFGEELSPAYRAAVARMADMHWRALELSATIAFLTANGRTRAEATAQALELKPDCAPWKVAAAELMDDLQQMVSAAN